MKLADSFLKTFIYLYEFIEYLESVGLGIEPLPGNVTSLALSDNQMPIKSLAQNDPVEKTDTQLSLVKNKQQDKSTMLDNIEDKQSIDEQNIDVNVIRANFKELLSNAWIKADESGYSPKVIEKSAYAVVALIDEKIMSSKWGTMSRWFKNTLQAEYFSISNAGIKVFEMIQELQDSGSMHKEIGEVFYYCLSCGLVGSYFNNPAKVREIKSDLLQYIKKDSQARMSDESTRSSSLDSETEVIQSHFMLKIKHIVGSVVHYLPFLLMTAMVGYFYILVDSALKT